MTIYWPYLLPWGYGHTTVMENVAVNQKIQISEDVIGPSPVPEDTAIPIVFRLGDCYPNPFNPQTSIAFDLPRETSVDLRIFDVSGHLVRKLIDGKAFTQGRRKALWNGQDDTGRPVASGTYFYRLEAGEFTETKQMSLIK